VKGSRVVAMVAKDYIRLNEKFATILLREHRVPPTELEVLLKLKWGDYVALN
jgi:hypothetical protein|tara:strand:- start:3838 stop:3993 length:156 start_codon:yes stop_codon:yes gene_type:complete